MPAGRAGRGVPGARVREIGRRSRTSIQYDEDSVGHLHDPRVGGGARDAHDSAGARRSAQRAASCRRRPIACSSSTPGTCCAASIPLQTLLLTRSLDAGRWRRSSDDTMSFGPREQRQQAAKAFERYDLVSAPVVDDRGKLVGRLTVDAVMDFVRDEADLRALKRAGLTRRRGSVRRAVGQRAQPLAVARHQPGDGLHRVARHRPVRGHDPAARRAGGAHADRRQHRRQHRQPDDGAHDPGAGGRSGHGCGARRLLNKELVVSLLNGIVWGVVVGLVAVALYANCALGAGDERRRGAEPRRRGAGRRRDSARAARDRPRSRRYGSSVLLTFITDAMGFFLFLGLASVFLF